MPVFALANAGVALAGLSTGSPRVGVAIAAGLLLGKPLGIVGATALMIRLRIAQLPRGVTWRGIVVLGLLGGIGFTVALFVSKLAFATRPQLDDVARIAVLAGSAASALIALAVARVLYRVPELHPRRSSVTIRGSA
jgi:NhaA family Na+:H+ antiporter